MDRRYAVLIGVAFEAAGLVAAFLFLGRWVDAKWSALWGVPHLGVISGVIIGNTLWISHLIILINQIEREEEEEEKKGKGKK